ncbi:MAG: HAD family hydrolase [Planctomycetota bacterium]
MSKPTFGVLFDVDGVLIDSYGAHLKTWQICCQRYGRECTEEQFAAGFGRTSREVIRDTWPDPPDDEFIRAFDEEKEELYRDLVANDFPHMPGARELIASLHERGIPMAIGSSGPPKNVHLAVQKLQAEDIIRTVITGADVVRGKPHPDVFLKGADGLGIDPGRCIVLEDAPPGIEAARAAGAKCLGIVSRGRMWDQLYRADHRVADDLRQVTPELLEQIVLGHCM